MATPATPTMRPRWSIAVSRCTADCTPSGMPSTSAINRLASVSSSVAGRRCLKSSSTGPAGRGALAEIAVHDARDVAAVLHPGRLVEAHGLFQLLHDLGRDQRPRLHDGGIAGQDIGQRERDDGHAHQGRDDERKPAQEVTEEGHFTSGEFHRVKRSKVSQRFSMPTRSARMTRVQLSYQSMPQTASSMTIFWAALAAARRFSAFGSW